MSDVTIFSALKGVIKSNQSLSGVDNRGGWWPIVHESFLGAWQANIEVRQDLVMANWAVYACITLIASDIGKMRLKLVQQNKDGIWLDTTNASYSPVLKKQNRYQTRQKFIEQWVTSKLSNGNAYILKERDNRGNVIHMYVLDPNRVQPLVAPDGSVYYQLQQDNIANVPEGLPAIPASEIIHDTMVCLFHPLVGISPIYACGLAATQGLKIQQNSAKFFENMSRPSGMLTAPGQISDPTATRLKEHWEKNFSGGNIGRVAVLGDGLKYEAMTVNAVDAQLVDQLKLSAEMVCTAFHVPAYKIGAGTMPTYDNAEVLNQIYYTDCIQALIESIEALLDEGLGLKDNLGTEFDLDDLIRMDTASKMQSVTEGVKGAVFTPNEGRKKFNLLPVAGGDTPYMQQQNYSLAALDERDRNDPFVKTVAPIAVAPPVKNTEQPEDLAAAKEFLAQITKGLVWN